MSDYCLYNFTIYISNDTETVPKVLIICIMFREICKDLKIVVHDWVQAHVLPFRSGDRFTKNLEAPTLPFSS